VKTEIEGEGQSMEGQIVGGMGVLNILLGYMQERWLLDGQVEKGVYTIQCCGDDKSWSGTVRALG
jgi:hypothetical protein